MATKIDMVYAAKTTCLEQLSAFTYTQSYSDEIILIGIQPHVYIQHNKATVQILVWWVMYTSMIDKTVMCPYLVSTQSMNQIIAMRWMYNKVAGKSLYQLVNY